MTRELVISAYDKDYSWIERLDQSVKVTVYRKGSNPKILENEVYIPINKGRCVHTFFNHIYEKYEDLSDYTFFAQDYPFDHFENIVYVINEDEPMIYEFNSQLKIGGYYGFHYNTIKVPSEKGGIMWNLYPSKHHSDGGRVLVCNSNGFPQDSNPRIDVNKYWNLFFECDHPEQYEFMPGGHFAITKEHARLRPLEFYKKVVDFLLEDEVAPWIVERLECYIFNPKYK